MFTNPWDEIRLYAFMLLLLPVALVRGQLEWPNAYLHKAGD